jgi:hypothetical protein
MGRGSARIPAVLTMAPVVGWGGAARLAAGGAGRELDARRGDWRLVGNKAGATRLGFAALLKFFELEARFPRHAGEVPPAAVDYLAGQVKVDPTLFASYSWTGRTIEYHRAQVRRALGFREASRADEEKLVFWLAAEVVPVEPSDERLREALLARCRAGRIEPPGRMERIVRAARAAAAERFCTATMARLAGTPAAERLEELVAEDQDEPATAGRGRLAELKADPGRPSLETLLTEVDKLERLRMLGLPDGLFTDAPEKLVGAWRARAAKEYPSDLRARAQPVRLTLLACLCWSRQTETTDGLVELLIALVHKIDARAERRVEGELLADLKRVPGKEGLLFALGEAAVAHPDETVRQALYPVVPGGEQTLKELVREAKATDVAFRQRVRTVLRASYSGHYRRMLPRLLETLEFRSNNAAHQPVVDALALLARYAGRPGAQRFYDRAERVPLERVVPAGWWDAVVDEHGKVERIPYELCVLKALREGLRRREVWVVGATRWRNPDEDLPQDFDANRDVHYAALRQPRDPSAFIAALQERMRRALGQLDEALAAGSAGGVRITSRAGQPWITVPKLAPQPEPLTLAALKDEVARRWGVVDLLDILKEADFLCGLTGEFASVATRQAIPAPVLQRRLLLVLFALGTNMGIRQLAGGEHGGAHGETEAALRHVRRVFVNRDNLRRAIVRLVNATLAVRDQTLWGQGTACASDSKKFGAWQSNLLTEWHARYRSAGVMIYWHVERRSVAIYSQLTSCSASEVAAMIQGCCTT